VGEWRYTRGGRGVGPESRVLCHRPELAAIAVGEKAAGEGWCAGRADGLRRREVVGSIDPLADEPGGRAEISGSVRVPARPPVHARHVNTRALPALRPRNPRALTTLTGTHGGLTLEE